jgi:hypothetical protein
MIPGEALSEDGSVAQEPNSSEGLEEPGGERWEIAAEEVAQAAAVTLERIEMLTALIIDQWRKRPVVMSAVAAVFAGVVLGTALAGQARSRHLTPAQKMTKSAGEAASKVASGLPSLRAVGGRDWFPARNGASQRAMRNFADRNSRAGARYAMELVPIAVALLKNPLVRQFAWKMATRGFRRK